MYTYTETQGVDMSLWTRSDLSDAEVSANMRKAAELLDQANALLQSTFEAGEDLYNMCSDIEDICGDLEMEADELDSLVK
jgi:hypothetical protein